MLEVDTVSPDSAGIALPPRQARNTIRRFYGFQLLTEAQFTGAIWVIFLYDRGYSLTEIGIAEAAFHAAPVLLELPSGSFADLVGRRWSMAVGAVLIALSSVFLWWAPTLTMVMLAMFLHGASFSFRSGADAAYLYDALGDRQHQYAGIFGKLSGARYLVAGGAFWLGAVLSDITYGAAFGLTVFTGMTAAMLALTLIEPPRQQHPSGGESALRRHAREARAVLASRPGLVAMLIFGGLYWTASAIPYYYLQAAFGDRGLSNGAIGAIAGGILIVNAFGSATAWRLARRGYFRRQVFVLSALTGAGLAVTAAPTLAIAIAGILFANIASGVIEPILSTWLNQQLPSEQRATLLSIESWMYSAGMIVFFPTAGWLGDHAGFTPLYVGCGAVTVLLGFWVLLAGRRLRPVPPTSP